MEVKRLRKRETMGYLNSQKLTRFMMEEGFPRVAAQ